MAYVLTKKGYRVDIFEKGPAYPYPYTAQFTERIRFSTRTLFTVLPKI